MQSEAKTLKRNMNPFETLLITLSGITPWCAVFMSAAYSIQLAGTGAFLSFLGAALIGLCVAFVYATYLDEDVGRPSLWATVTIIMASMGYYVLVLRPRGAWVLRGPDEASDRGQLRG